MGRPTKFRAGFFNWTIKWSSELVSETFGKTDCFFKTITIYKQSNKQIERETLFHEIMHVAGEDKYDAIFAFEQEKRDIDKEENLIRLLSPALMQILCDNKDLARFLFNVPKRV